MACIPEKNSSHRGHQRRPVVEPRTVAQLAPNMTIYPAKPGLAAAAGPPTMMRHTPSETATTPEISFSSEYSPKQNT
jgi:hypothetical protein